MFHCKASEFRVQLVGSPEECDNRGRRLSPVLILVVLAPYQHDIGRKRRERRDNPVDRRSDERLYLDCPIYQQKCMLSLIPMLNHPRKCSWRTLLSFSAKKTVTENVSLLYSGHPYLDVHPAVKRNMLECSFNVRYISVQPFLSSYGCVIIANFLFLFTFLNFSFLNLGRL